MKGNYWRRLGIAASAAVALWSGAGLALAQAHEGAETTLPQASKRIINYGLDSYKGIWIEAIGGKWYYAEFLNPCFGALPDHIAFKYNPDGSLNRFSQVIVPRQHQACVFKSFVSVLDPIEIQPAALKE